MPYMDIFGLQFRKTLVILEISTLELSKRKVLFKNKKVLNLGSKMPYLGVLSYNFERVLSSLKSTP